VTGGVSLVPMSADRFATWSRHSVASFAGQQVAAGLQGLSEATAYAEAQLQILLPDGWSTPGHHFWTAVAGGEEVGSLWVRVRTLPHETDAYVYDVDIVPAARGRGLGRATMLAAEQEARARDAGVLRLNVFGHNEAAISLYDSLGYAVVQAALTKPLAHPEGGPVDEAAVQLRDMTPDEYVAMRPSLERDRAAALSRAGLVPAAAARREAAEELAALLPRGRMSPGHLLRTAEVEGRAVGRVWLQLDGCPEGSQAVLQLLDAGVGEGGQHGDVAGLLPGVLAAVEQDCRARGATSATVSVFGFDSTALRFYRRSGFTLTAQLMAKAL
jgi:ribosomal protein S18 acetylase RimI-like enzyme